MEELSFQVLILLIAFGFLAAFIDSVVYKARVVVLQIGINNGHQLRPGMKKSDTPREAAEGVKAVLKVVMQKQPDARIILLGVFPAHFPSVNRIRWAAEINKLLQVFADGEQVIFKDFGKSFLKDPAHLKTELFIDGIHLSKAGFEVYAKQLTPVVKKYLLAPAPRSSKSVSAGKSTDAWCKFVATLVKKQQGKDLDILFAGDLHLWGMAEQQGKEAFKKYFGDRKTFNIAYINQRTENLLYQFRTYKHLEGLTPKLVVLQAGISNLYVRNMIDSIPAAAYGVRKVLEEIRKAIPNAKILLLGVTPVHYPGRNIIAEGLALDQQLMKLADGKTVFYKSMSGSFLKKDKTLDRSYYVNGLMLNKKGYEHYIQEIQQECNKLLNK